MVFFKTYNFAEFSLNFCLFCRFAPESAGELNSSWLYETMLENLPVPSTDEIKKTIMKGGYYTVSPQKGLRLIILNDNVCQLSDW